MNRFKQATGFLKLISQKKVPGQLVIQITDHCNAACLQCGMRKSNAYPRSSLSDTQIRDILDAAAPRNVWAVSFTGGEPLLKPERLISLIRYAGRLGISHIRTGTNGFLLANPHKKGFKARIDRLAARLAATPLRNFWISIDSIDPKMHANMRGFPYLMEGIAEALPIFHNHGIFPTANLGLNRNLGGDKTRLLEPENGIETDDYLARFREVYQKGLVAFYRFVADLGFTMASTCYPMSVPAKTSESGFHPVYSASAEERLVQFSPAERTVLFKALLNAVQQARGHLRIFSPLSALYALSRQNDNHHGAAYPCMGGRDFFFIDAQKGHTYPCGFRGNEDFGPYEDAAPGDSGLPCYLCDWECFRDPSELLGPLLDLRHNPAGLVRRYCKDRRRLSYWLADMAYYRACDYFDGRKPPHQNRLKTFNQFCRQ